MDSTRDFTPNPLPGGGSNTVVWGIVYFSLWEHPGIFYPFFSLENVLPGFFGIYPGFSEIRIGTHFKCIMEANAN